MTDVSADWAAWVSAAGTISATAAAVYIAQRGWKDARTERLLRNAAQARQVVMQQDGATIKIINFSQASILNVWTMNPVDELRGVICQVQLRGADSQGFLPVLGANETAIADVMTPSGEPADPAGSYRLTLRYTDATGFAWTREGNNTPGLLIDSPIRGYPRRARAR